MSESGAVIERVYREHASRILAVLVRIFGAHNFELAEDVLQEALQRAIVAWQEGGVPENPAAWLMAAAKNQAIAPVGIARKIALARAVFNLVPTVPPGASGRFLIEARIAEQHCTAQTFADTDWRAIVTLYDELVATTGSPVADLHRAVALGYAGDPQAAIARVQQLRENGALRSSHLPPAILAHLSALAGDALSARRYAEESSKLGGTAREQQSMLDQLARLLNDSSPAV